MIMLAVCRPARLTGISLAGIAILGHRLIDMPNSKSSQRKKVIKASCLPVFNEKII